MSWVDYIFNYGLLSTKLPSNARICPRWPQGSRAIPRFWRSLIDLLTLLSIELARILEEPDERYLQAKPEYAFPS
jgi:hypothetical protein